MLFSSYSASGLADSSPTQCMHINPSLGRGRVCGGIECGMRARAPRLGNARHHVHQLHLPALPLLSGGQPEPVHRSAADWSWMSLHRSSPTHVDLGRPSDREVPRPQAGLDAWLGSMNERTLSPCTHPHPYICVVEYPHLTAKK